MQVLPAAVVNRGVLMGSIQQQLQIYHIGGIVCFILLILSVLLAVLLFFLFDIPTIFMIRSGRMKKASLQKMTENNAKTDPLRKGPDMDYTTANMEDTQQLSFSGGSDETTLLDGFDRTEQLLTAEVLAPQTENAAAAPAEEKSSTVPEKEDEKDAGDDSFRMIEETIVIHTGESI